MIITVALTGGSFLLHDVMPVWIIHLAAAVTVTPVEESQITVQFKKVQRDSLGAGGWGGDSPVVIDVSCFADSVAYVGKHLETLIV